MFPVPDEGAECSLPLPVGGALRAPRELLVGPLRCCPGGIAVAAVRVGRDLLAPPPSLRLALGGGQLFAGPLRGRLHPGSGGKKGRTVLVLVHDNDEQTRMLPLSRHDARETGSPTKAERGPQKRQKIEKNGDLD